MKITVDAEEVAAQVTKKLSESIREKLDDMADDVAYRKQYYEASKTVESLGRELQEERKKTPSAFQIEQWDNAAKKLKKLTEATQIAYNEGYAAAYVDVTNRMKSGSPVNEQR